MRLTPVVVVLAAIAVALAPACGGAAFESDAQGHGAGGAPTTDATTSSSSSAQGGGGAGGADVGGGGAGGATSAVTTTSTTSSTSSGGHACDVDADCPDPMNECVLVQCKQGECVYPPVSAGIALLEQTSGNCRQEVCDGSGGLASKTDDSDVLDDGNDCTTDACESGASTHVAVDLGKACSGGVCDGAGACVGCNAPADCGTEMLCVAHQCVAPTCDDDTLDGMETDVDCGGPGCAPCSDGGGCVDDTDCASGVCAAGECLGPTCADGVTNGSETDFDCGGDTCAPCALGQACVVDAGCTTGACAFGVCAPSCTDGVKDGSESAVDCGGTCSPCSIGKACAHGYDCASHLCLLGHCAL
jgi:hypothetical protein